MAIKIAIANAKGGVGKTTTALCLAGALQQIPQKGKKKYKVLLIDTDPQRNSTGVYGAEIQDVNTLADILYSDTNANECIQHTRLGDIIAADPALQDADTQIKVDADRFYHLTDACKSIEDQYDFIICDCLPGNNVILGNVMSYCDYVVMPIICDSFGIQGMVDFSDLMSKYKKRINPSLKILGVLIVKYKGRQNLTRDLEDNLIPSIVKQMDTKVFQTRIRESVKTQEAFALRKSLIEHANDSNTAVDYMEWTKELLKEFGL